MDVGPAVVVTGVVVVVAATVVVGVAVVAGVAVSELPLHPETTNKKATATAYFLMIPVCHLSPEGGWGEVRTPSCRYAQATIYGQTPSSSGVLILVLERR